MYIRTRTPQFLNDLINISFNKTKLYPNTCHGQDEMHHLSLELFQVLEKLELKNAQT